MKNLNNSVNKPQQHQLNKGDNGIQGKVSKTSKTQRTINRHRDKLAELYRTDFITAMKLPDNEVLDDDSYWVIRDTWKLDWEKGVQVPIRPNELNNPSFKLNQIDVQTKISKQLTLKLPKKYLCPANDPNFDVNIHEAYITHRLVDDICRYDSDEIDVCWLNRINLVFQLMGIEQLTRINFERIIENLETQTHENLKEAIKTLESYSIEYDEEVVCDVCRSPDSEDTNEMVFCDGCNLCVHQACYGIDKIPQGSWLCAPCQLKLKPQCILCPNSGGAMKTTRNLRNWCHVSCALWIPEVGFGNPDKMEPIVNINKILPARWQLVCHLCKEKRGCCFQCSEKKCHSAFHITCAFKNNLEMQTILGHRNDDILFKAYCLKHSKKRQRYSHRDNNQFQTQQNELSTTNALNHSPAASLNQDLCKLNEQERKKETEKRIQKLDYEFYKFANVELTCDVLKLNRTHIDYVFNYWKLKRRYKQNKPLLIPKADEDLMNQSERLLNARIKMFIHLRQDLERVRNLCYMVVRRERLKKRYFELKTNIFFKQCEFVTKYGVERIGRTKDILLTKHPDCIYDYFDSTVVQESNDKKFDSDNTHQNEDRSSKIQHENIEERQNRLEKEIGLFKNNLISNNEAPPLQQQQPGSNNYLIDNENNKSSFSKKTFIESSNSNNNLKLKSLYKNSLRSTTNLINKTTIHANKNQLLSNQIKHKYKNIHLNNHSTQISTANANILQKNGFTPTISESAKKPTAINDNDDTNQCSTSDYETLKSINNNEMKFTRNRFLKCPNNKKLKLTPNVATPAPLQKSPKLRFSLRSSTSSPAAKPPISRSPSIKQTNSKQDFIKNHIGKLTFENGSF